MNSVIYAVDVGSTLSNRFAWCRVDDADSPFPSILLGTCIEALAEAVAADLNDGKSVALGLEAPLFIPVPKDQAELSRRREGEGNMSWAAQIGAAVATLAIHQGAWLLRKIHESVRDAAKDIKISVNRADWINRKNASPVLFCWEAFVSGPAHGKTHTQDAATAAMFFHANQEVLDSDVTIEEEPLISLFGAAVLWSGWSKDLWWLKAPLTVLRPREIWTGT
jgi:hypothetical protein